MALTTVVPNGNGTNGANFENIDEGTTSPNDADYFEVTAPNSLTRFFLLGDMPGDFDVATAVTIKSRHARTGSKGDFISWTTMRLYQSDETTVITADNTLTSTTTITTETFTPTITGGTSKTIWDGARIGYQTDAGTANTVRLYALQVEITYTAAAQSQAPRSMQVYRQWRMI